MRLIKEKTYNRYMKRLLNLMKLDPKASTKKGKEMLRIAKACAAYEKVKWPLHHSNRRSKASAVRL